MCVVPDCRPGAAARHPDAALPHPVGPDRHGRVAPARPQGAGGASASAQAEAGSRRPARRSRSPPRCNSTTSGSSWATALLSLVNPGDGPMLTDQIKALRRQLANEMGFVMPAVRIQDNMQLGANTYVIRIKEIEAGRGELRPNMLLVMDPRGEPIAPARRGHDRADLRPARHVGRRQPPRGGRLPRLHRGRPADGHHHASDRGHQGQHGGAAVLRRDPEAARRTAARSTRSWSPTWSRRTSRSAALQRVLQNLLSERISIRDLPTILEGVSEACGFTQHTTADHRARARPPRPPDLRHGAPGRTATSRWSPCRPSGSRRSLESITGQGDDRTARHGAVQAAGVHRQGARDVRQAGAHRRDARRC